MTKLSKNKPLFYMIMAGLLWGTSGIFVHYLSPLGFSALQMSALRGVVAVLCFFVYIVFKDKSLLIPSEATIIFSLASGISMYLCGSFYYTSMQMTSISTAVMLMYTSPVMVMAYSVLFMGEEFTNIKKFSLASMIIGCALVSGFISGIKFDIIGILFGIMSGIAYSAYSIFTKIEMKKQINPLTASFYCFVFMALTAVLAANPAGIFHNISNMPIELTPLVIFLGICTSVLPYFLYTLSLKSLPAGTASALSITEPMAATLYSILLFGEKMSMSSFFGIILILGPVFLLGREEH